MSDDRIAARNFQFRWPHLTERGCLSSKRDVFLHNRCLAFIFDHDEIARMRHSRRARRHRNEKQVDGLLHDDTSTHMHIGTVISKRSIESAKRVALDV